MLTKILDMFLPDPERRALQKLNLSGITADAVQRAVEQLTVDAGDVIMGQMATQKLVDIKGVELGLYARRVF